MAGVLTVVAEEIGRAVGLVWGGVGVAVRLNNQVMTVVLKVTSRIVQLLLLLTQKAADLLSIIMTDLFLFLGDVGNAVLAVGMALRSAMYLIINLFFGTYHSVISAASYSCHLVHTSYQGILLGMVRALAQLGNVLTLAKHMFILFGSSILFLISLLPNLVRLVLSGLLHLTSYLYLSCSQAVNSALLSLGYLADLCVSGVVNFVCDVPPEVVLGVVLGVGMIVGFKYTVCYMMDNMILVPDVPIPTLLSAASQRAIRWYVGMVQRVRQRPLEDVETEEEELDDANDENGNDNNDNVPDLNLPENQQQQPPEAPGLPLPILPLPGPPLLLPPPILPPPIVLPPALPPPQINEEPEEIQVQPIIPLLQARRPITRQRVNRRTQQETGEARTAGVKKPDRDSSSRVDNQAYQLYRELEQEREDRLCVVCQDQAKCVILLPCRHLCLCDACRSAIITRDNSCPVCRRPIMETLRVYV